jgi:hypothetical protein
MSQPSPTSSTKAPQVANQLPAGLIDFTTLITGYEIAGSTKKQILAELARANSNEDKDFRSKISCRTRYHCICVKEFNSEKGLAPPFSEPCQYVFRMTLKKSKLNKKKRKPKKIKKAPKKKRKSTSSSAEKDSSSDSSSDLSDGESESDHSESSSGDGLPVWVVKKYLQHTCVGPRAPCTERVRQVAGKEPLVPQLVNMLKINYDLTQKEIRNWYRSNNRMMVPSQIRHVLNAITMDVYGTADEQYASHIVRLQQLKRIDPDCSIVVVTSPQLRETVVSAKKDATPKPEAGEVKGTGTITVPENRYRGEIVVYGSMIRALLQGGGNFSTTTSFDACHLNNPQTRGVLYNATGFIHAGRNKRTILTYAVYVSTGNETKDGWLAINKTLRDAVDAAIIKWNSENVSDAPLVFATFKTRDDECRVTAEDVALARGLGSTPVSLNDRTKVTISDRCKGLEHALKAVFDKATERVCYFHLKDNCRKHGFNKDAIRALDGLALGVGSNIEFEQKKAVLIDLLDSKGRTYLETFCGDEVGKWSIRSFTVP